MEYSYEQFRKILTYSTKRGYSQWIFELFIFGKDNDLKSASENTIKSVLTKNDKKPKEIIDISSI